MMNADKLTTDIHR